MSHAQVYLLLMENDHVWDQEGWFLPLSKALEGVTAEQAAWTPQPGGNSIWATLRHLNYYKLRLLCRFTGKEAGPKVATNTATFEVPSGPDAEAAWESDLAQAREIAGEFRSFLLGQTDQTLDRLGESGRNLPHLLLHDAYHIGQIMMLRKLQGIWPATRD